MEKVCCVRQGEWEQKMEKYYMFEWNPDELFPFTRWKLQIREIIPATQFFGCSSAFLIWRSRKSSLARNFVYIFRVCVLSKETVSLGVVKLWMESFWLFANESGKFSSLAELSSAWHFVRSLFGDKIFQTRKVNFYCTTSMLFFRTSTNPIAQCLFISQS